MKRGMLYATLIAVSLGCLIGTVGAQGEKVGDMAQQFVHKAASSGKAEVQLGKMAQEQAASSDVQQFGQRMVTDHTQANEELMAIAQDKNIDVPTKMDAKHQQTAEALAKLNGASFDRAYMRQMVEDHEKAVQLFSKEAQQGQDADLKAFAAKTLPILEEHLQLARQLVQQQKVSQTR